MNFEQIMPATSFDFSFNISASWFYFIKLKLKSIPKKYIYLGYNCFGCCDSSIFHLTNEKNKFSYFWMHGTYGTADN